jgi:hypothetical protein
MSDVSPNAVQHSPCLAPRACPDHIIPAVRGIFNCASKHGSTLGRVIIAFLAAAIRGETTAPRVFTEGNIKSAVEAVKTNGSAAQPQLRKDIYCLEEGSMRVCRHS